MGGWLHHATPLSWLKTHNKIYQLVENIFLHHLKMVFLLDKKDLLKNRL
jgi:hypothetical protein